MTESTGVGRGRPKAPATIHILRGDPSKIGSQVLKREAEAVPPAKATLPCPRWLRGDARREWLWIAPRLLNYRILADVDRTLLEQYCVAYARWREAERELETAPKVIAARAPDGSTKLIRNPWLKISYDAWRQVQVALMQLGMTPTARAAILSKERDPLPAMPAPNNGNSSRGAASARPDPLGILGS